MLNATRTSQVAVLACVAMLFSGCLKDVSEETKTTYCPASQQLNCSLTETLVYPVGTNVSTDFSVIDVTMTDTVVSSTCSGASPGQTVYVYIPTMSRTSNTLRVQHGAGGPTHTFTVSGTTVTPMTQSGCSGGVTVTQNVTGNLNTTLNKVELSVTTNLVTSNCCGETISFQESGSDGSSGLMNTGFLEVR